MDYINTLTPKKKTLITTQYPELPTFAYHALNRCNLPAVILGSATYQQYPSALFIDCVGEFHRPLFDALASIAEASTRALHFKQYMKSAFLLDKTSQAGFTKGAIRSDKLDYLRLLRGWMFNADGIEGAVLKRWVESRFGLATLNHHGPISAINNPLHARYQADYVQGLYNSNALESQLDLLYYYCQYELSRRWPKQQHLLLYRGINHIENYHQVSVINHFKRFVLLNNLNSFSDDRYLTESFGDVILETHVPMTKLLYFPQLLTGVLQGENEYLVLGGIYPVTIVP